MAKPNLPKDYNAEPSDALFHGDTKEAARLRRLVDEEVASLKLGEKKKPTVAKAAPKRSPLKTAALQKASPRKPFAPFGGRVRKAIKRVVSSPKRLAKRSIPRSAPVANPQGIKGVEEQVRKIKRRRLASMHRARGRFGQIRHKA